MVDLMCGKDTLEVSDKIAVGVVMVHGDFPSAKTRWGHGRGFLFMGRRKGMLPASHDG